MMTTHIKFFKTTTQEGFELYSKALHACGVAIGKEVNRNRNYYSGASAEAIVIAEEAASQKLFHAVGTMMRLQQKTGVRFLPEQHVKLDDNIRWSWCEDFYCDALSAIDEIRAERATLSA